jgi:hypothetical protein
MASVPPDVVPNANGKHVMTIYSTSDSSNLTSMTSQPSVVDLLLDSTLQYNQRRKGTTINDTLLRGEQESAGPRRCSASGDGADNVVIKRAKREVSELLGNLLATTGAPAFQNDYDDDNNDCNIGGGGGGGRPNLFLLPLALSGSTPTTSSPTSCPCPPPPFAPGTDVRCGRSCPTLSSVRLGMTATTPTTDQRGGDTTGHWRRWGPSSRVIARQRCIGLHGRCQQ